MIKQAQIAYPLALPLKSVAGALLFSVFLGPIGLLYASTLGGTILIVLAFVGICIKQFVTVSLIWIVACIWSVSAANRYNRKVLRSMMSA